VHNARQCKAVQSHGDKITTYLINLILVLILILGAFLSDG
jgi:hypothetical protein